MSLLDVEIPEPESETVTAYTCPLCRQAFIHRDEYERHYPRCRIGEMKGAYVTWVDRDFDGHTARYYGRVTAAYAAKTETDHDLGVYETAAPCVELIGVAEQLRNGEPDIMESEADPGEVEPCPKEKVEEVVERVAAMYALVLMKEVMG